MLVDKCLVVNKDIELKQLELKDLEILFNLTVKNQKFLLPWFDWASDLSIRNSQTFIENSIEKNLKGIGCDLGIFYKNELVGVIALINYNNETDEIEIAYWLSQDFNGKGIITNSCRKLENYCFNELNFDKVYIIAFAENLPSRTIPEKLGFKIVNADKNATEINHKKSYYIYYLKTQSEYKSNFWIYLENIIHNSEIVLDSKTGEFDKYLDMVVPVDFGHLKNDWAIQDQIDIFIGSSSNNNLKSIICTLDLNNKFTDLKVLYKCTIEEKNIIFSILNQKDGVLLINK